MQVMGEAHVAYEKHLWGKIHAMGEVRCSESVACGAGGERAAVCDVWHVLAVPADGHVLPAQVPAAQRALASAAHPPPRSRRRPNKSWCLKTIFRESPVRRSAQEEPRTRPPLLPYLWEQAIHLENALMGMKKGTLKNDTLLIPGGSEGDQNPGGSTVKRISEV